MKSPPTQVADDEAFEATERFIRDNARQVAREQDPATA
jgi:hypothetical protein